MAFRPSKETRAKMRLITALPVIVGGFVGLKKGEQKLVPTVLMAATVAVECYYAIQFLRTPQDEEAEAAA